MDNLIKSLRTVEDRNLALSMADIPKKTKDVLKKIPVVRLTLAIKPTPGILDLIDEFFVKNIGTKVLIEWDVDEEIVAGAKIIYKGTYGNYSVSKNF